MGQHADGRLDLFNNGEQSSLDGLEKKIKKTGTVLLQKLALLKKQFKIQGIKEDIKMQPINGLCLHEAPAQLAAQ